jgi:hypothetical protein
MAGQIGSAVQRGSAINLQVRSKDSRSRANPPPSTLAIVGKAVLAAIGCVGERRADIEVHFIEIASRIENDIHIV